MSPPTMPHALVVSTVLWYIPPAPTPETYGKVWGDLRPIDRIFITSLSSVNATPHARERWPLQMAGREKKGGICTVAAFELTSTIVNISAVGRKLSNVRNRSYSRDVSPGSCATGCRAPALSLQMITKYSTLRTRGDDGWGIFRGPLHR